MFLFKNTAVAIAGLEIGQNRILIIGRKVLKTDTEEARKEQKNVKKIPNDRILDAHVTLLSPIGEKSAN